MSANKIPVINCISNIVTANDCANVLLAAGFSAIMADEPQEMEDIARAADAIVINLGTPSDRKYEAARAGGLAYNALHKPVIIDPVGVAVSDYRRQRLKELLSIVHPDVIRCNLSEAKAILKLITDGDADAAACCDVAAVYSDAAVYSNVTMHSNATVHSDAAAYCDVPAVYSDAAAYCDADADANCNAATTVYCDATADADTEHTDNGDTCGIDSREDSDTNMKLTPKTARQLALSLQAVVLISGAADVVSDGTNVSIIEGGSDKLKSITGAGCMLSALCGGFAAGIECTSMSGREAMYDSICEASRFFKRAAELAESRLSGIGGTGELRMRLIDACGCIRRG